MSRRTELRVVKDMLEQSSRSIERRWMMRAGATVMAYEDERYYFVVRNDAA